MTNCIYTIAAFTTKQASALLYKDAVLFAMVYDALGRQLAAGSSDPSSPRGKAAGQLGMLALCGDPGSQIDLMDTLYRTARKHALPTQHRSCFSREVQEEHKKRSLSSQPCPRPPQFVRELTTAASTPLSAIDSLEDVVRQLLATYLKTLPPTLVQGAPTYDDWLDLHCHLHCPHTARASTLTRVCSCWVARPTWRSSHSTWGCMDSAWVSAKRMRTTSLSTCCLVRGCFPFRVSSDYHLDNEYTYI